MFVLNRKFARELRSRLIHTNNKFFPKKIREKIPTNKHLQEIVSKIFWASTQPEEGRSARFRVAYAMPSGIEHLGLRFNFSSAKLWNTNELVKLGPAVVPPNGTVCVYPFMGDLYIQGLTTLSPTSVVFEILDPARIVVKFPLTSVVAEITGERADFINQSWGREGVDLIQTYDPKEKNFELGVIISLLYGNVVSGALLRMRLLGHGGTIIFVGGDNSWKKSIEKPIAFECEQTYNGTRRIESSLRTELRMMPDVLERGINLLASPVYSAAIGDTARTLAYLSGIDGAVVLTKSLSVLAFGAKVKEKQKVRTVEKVIKITPHENDTPKETSLADAFRGKRHLSTARFIIDHPNAVAVTVSQDGGITGFVMKDRSLHAYRGLELLL